MTKRQLCDSTPIVSERTDECAPDRALDPAVLYRLKLFSAMNKLKKVALQAGEIIVIQAPLQLNGCKDMNLKN
ncbi:Calcium-dependent protein kinase 5, variant 2 [Trifolium repens]|nr:Calcium-dependent protein kinase 5, variant 2 [Trifolium repens]WJX32865.1 Calcium-dependent protein kinase 5, variant 2 [Trifolium repens]WJX38776.1 Calcium-dependent protein kinase 5, variant 2 [Trifolium repens]WJX71291.1 Calcium-dependent protein kinase 5, variant 2 [Trifolium repens]